ncbi:hypothetical protein LTR62_004307 [Meristemomyces frigidus]|uniref:NAD(P)-binding protein n=1 Tax=Meristemomyces frigidus TaxID=1508187 RepID=A0AAN7TI06_9PEZI|nr:hypothetical protein LTR62_004307 [Meristemomyces frigidus]
MSTPKSILLLVGGNQGLGFYAAQQLAATGTYHILLTSRSLSKARRAIEEIVSDDSYGKINKDDLEPLELDITNDDSIKAAAKHVTDTHGGKLDILLANAGIALPQAAAPDGTGPTLRELYTRHYDTNVFGLAVVVDTFLPLLQRGQGKRISFTSSGLGSLKLAMEEGPYSGEHYPVYRSTKSAVNMVMVHYARLLEKEGFVVSASDPGYCATNLNRYSGLKDPRDGCKALIISATGEKGRVHGRVVDDQGEMVPW